MTAPILSSEIKFSSSACVPPPVKFQVKTHQNESAVSVDHVRASRKRTDAMHLEETQLLFKRGSYKRFVQTFTLFAPT